ncbi:cation transporter [Brevibacillus reuszeri]|uniref:Cation transporter n=1 Tax=Brevibacillus reuszeri TaxID=54915 RepID=A0A0K9YRN7_9BACL|nr:cation diffusion facilitator family transporter [Brevibacillus reuszeri]KNB71384.1 cation transporter [Brevibacillus reuszeri]MED1857838.1 cation diffusion facilitator family transporter [Brevibacillus reuszeri]GED66331.1 cation transporter [Brevibacillus reuszeri]
MGHHHDHGDGHGHHHHGKGASKKALLVSFIIISLFLIVEVIGGFLTNSLALLSDAGHMLSDASALLLSLIAIHFAARPPTAKRSFGLHRFEILAALINGVTLVVISLIIFWEAYQRFFDPPQVASGKMIIIATIGLLANIAAAFVLMRGDFKDNVNVRSAFLHVLGDLLGSVGAIVGGILMWSFDWYIADPLISVIVAVLILLSAWRVTKDSVNILLESTPSQIDLTLVESKLSQLAGVTKVHDLHIWTVTSGFDSLTCHLIVEDHLPSYPLLNEALELLRHDFGITHATIQIENSSVQHGDLHCQVGADPHSHEAEHHCQEKKRSE